MIYSVIKISQCAKYDFKHFLFSPEFFLDDKTTYWDALDSKAHNACNYYYDLIKDTLNKIENDHIVYDLTDALSKFLDSGAQIDRIGSLKKIAQPGDFVISRLRSYLQEMAIVEERKLTQLFSSEFMVFRAKTNQISTHTLFALCMTDAVQTILKRGQYGTEHPRFYEFLLTGLPIPVGLLTIDPIIKKTIQNALSSRKLSKVRYAEAEALLLSELGLADWRPKRTLAFVKNYSDARRAERIDADYFQPKYDEIVNAVKAYPGGWDALGNLAHIKPSNFKPAAETEYRYIELANIGRNGEIIAHTRDYGHNLPTRARCKVAAGDVIASSIEGSLDSVALIPEEYDNALCSTGFYAVSSSAINSETLLTLLKSSVGQMQLKKGCSGTILTAINSDEFKKLALPLILPDKQREIERKVAESFNLRSRSKELLEYAKRAVEIAIEQDENAAIDWLRQKTEGVGV